MSWAALQHDDGWIVAEGPNSVLDLAEWVLWRHPRVAQFLLRKPLWLSCEPNSFALGLIKVVAKRWRLAAAESFTAFVAAQSSASDHIERVDRAVLALARVEWLKASEVKLSQTSKNNFTNLHVASEWVRAQVEELREGDLRVSTLASDEIVTRPLYKKDRPIVAALFVRERGEGDDRLRLVTAARNTNGEIRTRHAEMNLLDLLMQKSALAMSSYVLIVSLQSCRMCAGALVNHTYEVYYLEDEPALLHAKTALHGRERRLSC